MSKIFDQHGKEVLTLDGRTKQERLEAELKRAKEGEGREVGQQFRKDLADKLTKEKGALIEEQTNDLIKKRLGKDRFQQFLDYAAATMDMWAMQFDNPEQWRMNLVLTKYPKEGEEVQPLTVIVGNEPEEKVLEAVVRFVELNKAKEIQSKTG